MTASLLLVGLCSLTSACALGAKAADRPVHFQQTSTQTSAHSIRVGLIEWTITTSAHRVPPGRVVLQVTNAGATIHDLAVQGPLGTWETPDLHPGQHARLVVYGRPGQTLRLWCAEPGHEHAGMHTTLVVRRAG